MYIKLAPKGCRMNRDVGRELWIRTITNALKEPVYKPHPPREPRPRDNRPLPRMGNCHVTSSHATNFSSTNSQETDSN